LPEGFILDVAAFLVWKLFFGKGKIHAPGRKWTAFTPPVTVVVNATDVLFVAGELQEVFFFHRSLTVRDYDLPAPISTCH
jgi:hypothetical protein